MPRTIKFRAWCGDLDRMVYQEEDVHFWMGQNGFWSVNTNCPEEIIADTLESTPYPVLMQFTGLLDKSGVEVWEGDIVHFSYGIPPIGVDAPIVFDGGAFWAITEGHNPERCLLGDLATAVGEFCVVGNVYEDTGPKEATNGSAE